MQQTSYLRNKGSRAVRAFCEVLALCLAVGCNSGGSGSEGDAGSAVNVSTGVTDQGGTWQQVAVSDVTAGGMLVPQV
ncbi:hypothetical protein EG829_28895, partial [bacterium]|nr:hypothetical protein [bacterium]